VLQAADERQRPWCSQAVLVVEKVEEECMGGMSDDSMTIEEEEKDEMTRM